METRDIRYFGVVAEYGNVGRAAEALGISPTALSKSLRRLEKSVGAKLVKRTVKGVDLTAAGQALSERAQKLQLTLDDIRQEAADIGSGRAGHIRAGFTVGTYEHCVRDAYAVLRKEAPQVSLDASILIGKQLTPFVLSGQGDFVIRSMNPALPRELAFEELFCDQRRIFAWARHSLARRKRVTFAELSKEQWVSQYAPKVWDEICQMFRDRNIEPPRILLNANSLEFRLSLLEGSNLVMCSSSITMGKFKERYRLVELPVEGFHIERRVGVCYRKDGYLSPAAKRMIEILKEQGRAITTNQRHRG